jgi:hypothetical protein
MPVAGGDDEYFDDERLKFIEVGKSTKESISAAMSDFTIENDEGPGKVSLTPISFRDGDWWLYAQTRRETTWVALTLDGAVFPGETIEGKDYRFLLIKFDENGVVDSFEISKSEGSGCNRQGICAQGPTFMLLAPEVEDKAAKRFDVATNSCNVYLYGKSRATVSIWIDGHWVGWHLNKNQYFFWQLDQGTHQLASHTRDRMIEFKCIGGDLGFFELKWQGYWADIEHRDAAKGRRAIAKGRLTLTMAEPPG